MMGYLVVVVTLALPLLLLAVSVVWLVRSAGGRHQARKDLETCERIYRSS